MVSYMEAEEIVWGSERILWGSSLANYSPVTIRKQQSGWTGLLCANVVRQWDLVLWFYNTVLLLGWWSLKHSTKEIGQGQLKRAHGTKSIFQSMAPFHQLSFPDQHRNCDTELRSWNSVESLTIFKTRYIYEINKTT